MADSNSKWTIETLLELLNERDRRYDESRQAAEKALVIAEQHAEQWRER